MHVIVCAWECGAWACARAAVVPGSPMGPWEGEWWRIWVSCEHSSKQLSVISLGFWGTRCPLLQAVATRLCQCLPGSSLFSLGQGGAMVQFGLHSAPPLLIKASNDMLLPRTCLTHPALELLFISELVQQLVQPRQQPVNHCPVRQGLEQPRAALLPDGLHAGVLRPLPKVGKQARSCFGAGIIFFCRGTIFYLY